MRTFLLKLLRPLPRCIQLLTFHLREGCDVILEIDDFPGWEIFAQKHLGETIPVLNEFVFEFKNQDLALSFNEKGNSLKQIVLLKTPFILIISHFSKKEAMWLWGFSIR